jgi:acetyl-CoA acyltransferase
MGTESREAVIVDVVRTTFGKRGGALQHWHPADLFGFAIGTLLERAGADPGRIDDVIGGCVGQVGEQSTNVTRNAWVSAGLPQHVPATTVDRQCGSSQQAIHFAAAGVVAGHYDMVVAGGVECMSRVPMAKNARGGTGPFPPSFLEHIDGRLWAQFRIAQVLADRYGITRQEMDEYSLESHRRAAAAWDAGLLSREVVATPIKAEDGSFTGESLSIDEGIRRNGSMEALAALPPAQNWEPDTAPDITAGNSSQMNDGAGAMLIAERSFAESLGLPVRARFAHFAVAAEDAAIVLSAPVPVTHKLLERSGMKVDEFDAIECNEAFAAIALMWAHAFDPDRERYNPHGGAIAMGHPLGASGVRLCGSLLSRLEAVGGRYGFQTMCEGGGQANATVIERLG